MKIIPRPDHFEVKSNDGSIVKRFFFDDNASRRGITGKVKRKVALQQAKTFAGKGWTMEEAE